MATRGKSARSKGNSYELQIRNVFKDLGWVRCCSARSESKNLDDSGVDLFGAEPFNVQCKAVENMGSAHKTLASMPKDSNYNLVFHKKNRSGTVVSLEMEDFVEILQMLISNGVIKPK